MVVNVAKEYLHGLSSSFNSPKLELHIGDGFEFLRQRKNQFDVIITDSSDPIGFFWIFIFLNYARSLVMEKGLGKRGVGFLKIFFCMLLKIKKIVAAGQFTRKRQ